MEQQPASTRSLFETQVLEKFGKLEKFLGNQNLILQKMNEKMEIIESDNTKSTMRYNSFREDYKRLIEEQVDMRTASYKGEFISLDELRPVKIAIKEIEVRLRSKLDVSTFNDQVQRRDKQQEEFDAIMHAELQKLRLAMDDHIQHLKKADAESRTNIQQLREYLVGVIVKKEQESQRKWGDNDKRLCDIVQTNDTLTSRLEQLALLVNSNKQTYEHQAKLKQEQQSRRFKDTDKKITELDKKLRVEISERTQTLGISLEALAARESNNYTQFEHQLAQLTDKLAEIVEKTETKAQQQMDKLDMIQGSIDGGRADFEDQRAKVSTELEAIKTSIESLKVLAETAQQQQGEDSPKSKSRHDSKILLNDPRSRKPTSNSRANDNEGEPEDAISPTNRNRVKIQEQFDKLNQNRESRSGTVSLIEAKATILQEEIEGGSLPVFGSNPRPSLNYSPANLEQSPNLKNFKLRLSEMQSSISILREMIDSKVNFSEVVKLQESKCSKITFKELVSKLETFKTTLEKQLTNGDALRQISFDESMAGTTISRLSMIRTRQQQTPLDNSRNGSKERDKEKQPERKSFYSRLPNMLSHSRKRYLTLLDRSETHTVHQTRPLNLP